MVIAICTFSLAVAAVPHEVARLSTNEWLDVGSTMATLIQMAAARLDSGPIGMHWPWVKKAMG